MMTKTDYELVARGLSRIEDKENRMEIGWSLSRELKLRNPLFDREKFLAMAEVWPCGFCDYLADSKDDNEKHYNMQHYNKVAK